MKSINNNQGIRENFSSTLRLSILGRMIRKKVSLILLLVLVTIILFIRKTDAFIQPQFWAEDGSVFFLQQYENGVSAIFQPYAGYLHLVPRLIALFADTFFPYSAIPSVYNYLSLTITLFVVASIFSPRFKSNYKPLLALVIVLVPHYTNEVFMTITNIQWILSILPIILLMKEKPNYRYGNIYVQFAFDFMVIIFCGLTGPFLIFLTPFFAWKWFNNKNLYNFSIVSVAVIVALIQLGFIEFTSTSKLLENPSLALFLKANSAVLGQKFFGGLFLGRIRVYKINPYFLSLLYFCLIFVILRFSLIKNKFVITCLGIQLIIIIVVFYKFRATPEVLIPSGSGMRYFHIPSIMIAWSLIALLEEKEEWKRNLTKMLLILILISSLKSGFHSTKFIDYDWKRYSQLIGKEDVVIPINPKGWEFKLKGHPP